GPSPGSVYIFSGDNPWTPGSTQSASTLAHVKLNHNLPLLGYELATAGNVLDSSTTRLPDLLLTRASQNFTFSHFIISGSSLVNPGTMTLAAASTSLGAVGWVVLLGNVDGQAGDDLGIIGRAETDTLVEDGIPNRHLVGRVFLS